jgi:hypothetical protein
VPSLSLSLCALTLTHDRYDSEEEKAYYSKEPRVINLELLCPDNGNGASAPGATANTTNLQLG